MGMAQESTGIDRNKILLVNFIAYVQTHSSKSPAQEASTPFFCFLHFYPHSFKAHHQVMSNSLFFPASPMSSFPFHVYPVMKQMSLAQKWFKSGKCFNKIKIWESFTVCSAAAHCQQSLNGICTTICSSSMQMSQNQKSETLPIRASTESLLQKFETILRPLPAKNSSNLH